MKTSKNSPEYWKEIRLGKYSEAGVERAVDPRKTLQIAKDAASRVGIAMADDVRTESGKSGGARQGCEPVPYDGFLLSSLMEEIEHHAAQFCDYDVVVASYGELSRQHRCVCPHEIIVPELCRYSEDLALEWVCGYDLLNMSETFVPLNAVICPYTPHHGAMLFYACTNGLASGNTRVEALCHALCEIIERDAQAIAGARTCVGPLVRDLMGVKTAETSVHHPRRISLNGLPKPADSLIAELKGSGLSVYLRDLTWTAGIATIDCTVVERTQSDGANAYTGAAAHPDARVALWRALTEAVQSRTTSIANPDSGIPQIRRKTHRQINEILSAGDCVLFEQLPSFEHKYIDEDLDFLLGSLPHYGLRQVIAFDLTHPEVRVPVIRAVLPGAETWHVFHLLTGRGRFGPRIVEELQTMY